MPQTLSAMTDTEQLPACPDCGGPTRQAFATTSAYISCRRCGHVHPNTTVPQTLTAENVSITR